MRKAVMVFPAQNTSTSCLRNHLDPSGSLYFKNAKTDPPDFRNKLLQALHQV